MEVKTILGKTVFWYGMVWLSIIALIISLASLVLPEAVSALAPADESEASSHTRYSIEIDLDFHAAKFRGRQTVKFVNTSTAELDSLSFNLYPNMGLTEEEDPRLFIESVSSGLRDLKFGLRSRNSLLRVELPYKLAPKTKIELTIEFSAKVPRILREETSLLAHFLQEINDAVSEERQPRDARDIFFNSEDSMLLGYFYPVVAPRQSQLGDQGPVPGVGGIVFSDVADYQVSVQTEADLAIIASGRREDLLKKVSSESGVAGVTGVARQTAVFRGDNLRGFAIVIADKIKNVEQKVGSVRVVSYFREGDEKLGARTLTIAANALATYSKTFGDYPYPILQVVELPLAAGYSGIDFPALVALAQAYYIDFDSPQSARLPGVLKEQANIIKSSFEFSLAQAIANQWWGGVVGSDPERSPYLDEALGAFSAAYYHEMIYGKQLGDLVVDQQLRGAYQAYRMLGGVDIEVDRSVKDFKNALQYTAIAQAKGALMFIELRKQLGDERFFKALRHYFDKHKFGAATPEQLRYEFQASAEDPKVVRQIFQHWLREKHADEDIGTPDLTLVPPPVSKIRALGRVFVKIGRTAARPF